MPWQSSTYSANIRSPPPDEARGSDNTSDFESARRPWAPLILTCSPLLPRCSSAATAFGEGFTEVFPDLPEDEQTGYNMILHQTPDGGKYWLGGKDGKIKQVRKCKHYRLCRSAVLSLHPPLI